MRKTLTVVKLKTRWKLVAKMIRSRVSGPGRRDLGDPYAGTAEAGRNCGCEGSVKIKGGERMSGKKTIEEKIEAIVRPKFAQIIEELKKDHQEYRRRLELKEETRGALEKAETDVQMLYSRRIEIKKRFWEAYYEKEDEDEVSEIESEHGLIERATKKAERSLEKARADFEKADFDEVAESFALMAKANIADDEVNRQLDALEGTLESLLTGVRHNLKEVSQTLRGEYVEPHFDTTEERNAHVGMTIELLNEVAESYAPGSRQGATRDNRKTRQRMAKTVPAPKKPRRSRLRRLLRR